MKERGNLLIGILIGLLIAGGLFGVYYFGTLRNYKTQPQNTAVSPKLLPQSAQSPALVPVASTPKYATFMRNGQIWFMDFTINRSVKDYAVKVSKTTKVELPKLSPNGKYVVYFSIIHATGGFPTSNVYIADTQGTSETNLGVTDEFASRLNWSNDGNTVGLILFPSGATGKTIAVLYDVQANKIVKELELNTLRDDQYGHKVLTIDKSYDVNLNCQQLESKYINFCAQFQSILNQNQTPLSASYKTEEYAKSQYVKLNYKLIRSDKLSNGLVVLEFYSGEPQNPESKWGEGGGSFVPGYDEGVTQTYTILLDESTSKVIKEIPLAINSNFIF